MDASELDEKIRQHYRARQLPSERLNALVQADHRHRQRRNVLGAGLAVCVAGLAGGLLVRHGGVSERTRSTMREVALNHATQFSVEFAGVNDIDELNKRMLLLPFSVSIPEKLVNKVDVLGARYCTISGSLAVHLKLFDQQSRRTVSLFMTPVLDDLLAIDNEGTSVEGVEVRLWQEKELFYALAQ